jgi:hypothetical protein
MGQIREAGLSDSGNAAIDGFKIAATLGAALTHRRNDEAISAFGAGATGNRPLQ